MLKPTIITKNNNGEDEEISISRLFTIKNRALLKELTLWSSDGNYDRHDALAMLMLIREDKLRLMGDNSFNTREIVDNNYLGNDDFFNVNYKEPKSNNWVIDN